jgi:hypothetical protein
MNHEIALEDMTRRGGMVKSPFDMTPDEYADWKIQVQVRAREYLFSIGQPYVALKDGVFVAEFADGHIQRID